MIIDKQHIVSNVTDQIFPCLFKLLTNRPELTELLTVRSFRHREQHSLVLVVHYVLMLATNHFLCHLVDLNPGGLVL